VIKYTFIYVGLVWVRYVKNYQCKLDQLDATKKFPTQLKKKPT